jgi:acyl-CoA thioesterase FadM
MQPISNSQINLTVNLFFRLFITLIKSPFKKKVGFLETCETKFIALPSDLDLNFHMNNGIYFSLMDLGRLDYIFRSGFLKKLLKQGMYPLVASQMIRYNKSINLFARFKIRTNTIGWDDKFFYLKQEFISETDQTLAVAVVKARFKIRKAGGVKPSDLAILCDIDPTSPILPNWIKEWIDSEKGMIS